MNKDKLNKFIQKYNLGGNISSVKWKFEDNKLKTNFVTDDKTLLGNITLDNIEFEDCTLGVYSTSQLQKMLSVLDNSIQLALTKVGDKAVSLNVKDDRVSIDYQLSDLVVIQDPPALKKLPNFGTKFKIDGDFINTFIRGKNALMDVDSFTILAGEYPKCIIGYDKNNTNRITMPLNVIENTLTENIIFNANLFKEVLSANKECTSAIFEISNEGLGRITFNIDDYNCIYYTVAIQGIS